MFACRTSSCGAWRRIGVWWHFERGCGAEIEGFERLVDGSGGFVVVKDVIDERGFVGERFGLRSDDKLDRRCFERKVFR